MLPDHPRAQVQDDPWHLLELSEPLELLEQGKLDGVIDPTQPNHPFDCVVFGHRTVLTPGELGFEYVAPSAGSEAPVPAPAGAPPGLVESDAPGLDAGEVLGVEVEGAADTALAGPQDDGQAEAVMQDAIHDHGGEMPESITIDDVVLTAETNLRTLRAACQSLQVGKSGSRATVFKRLVERLRQMKVAASAAVHAESIPEVIVPSQPAEPTPEARRQHESTHLPYAPWCEVCVAHKARDNAHHPTDPAERIPTISFDFGFSSRDDDGRQKLCCLFLHDSVIGWREAIAVPGKGGVHGGLHVQAEVCRLLAFLGYRNVRLRSDPEQTCLSLQHEIARVRQRVGLRTVTGQVAEEDHEANGGAESTVHVLRAQAGTILAAFERRTKSRIRTDHPLYSWSYRHAAWLINRFSVQAGGIASYEAATGRPYKGPVLPFGETCMVLVKQAPKGQARFIQAMMLGKLPSSDQWVSVTAAGRLMLSRTARRLSESFEPLSPDVLKDPTWKHGSFLTGATGGPQQLRREAPLTSRERRELCVPFCRQEESSCLF